MNPESMSGQKKDRRKADRCLENILACGRGRGRRGEAFLVVSSAFLSSLHDASPETNTRHGRRQ